MKFMVRFLMALIAATAALLVLVPAATSSAALQFSTSQDMQYVSTLTADGIFSHDGTVGLIMAGHQAASDVYYGVRTPAAEQRFVYVSTPLSIGRPEANEIVNVALFVYLGVPYPSTTT